MFGIVLGAIVVGFALIGLGTFISWRRRLVARLVCGSEVILTSRGPVEFARLGTGPVMLSLHGGAAGCDQTPALSWNIHEAGFMLLTPSRPGYLRTPLDTGATPEQAADAMAALLDAIKIEKVIVMGTSGGGPTALQ